MFPIDRQKSGSHDRMGVGNRRRRFPRFRDVTLPVSAFIFCVSRWVAIVLGSVIRPQIGTSAGEGQLNWQPQECE
jgi:hypothetical protein